MADNVALPASGVTAATDEIGGVHHQRIKVGHGADGSYTDTSAANPFPAVTTGGSSELTGSAAANNTDLIASTDVRGYRSFSIQLTGTWSATVQAQQSNDGTTWYTIPLTTPAAWTAGTPGSYSTAGMQAVGFYAGTVQSKYLRVRTTAYTSGTASAILVLSQHVTHPPPYLNTTATGTAKVEFDTGTVTSADARANTAWDNEAVAGLVLYNGTTWDRIRNVTAVDGAGSTGLLAAGAVGFDNVAAVNRRIRVDATGYLLTNAAPATASTLTNVSASASSVTVLASSATRKGASFYNDSSAPCYLKLGATASTTSFSVKIAAGGFYELAPAAIYRGVIDGIWDSATGSMRVTELT